MTTKSLRVPLGGLFTLAIAGLLLLATSGSAAAQTSAQRVQLAKLAIDPAQLNRYKAALTEEIETSLRIEPGVLTLYAVAEQADPTHLTILEIYASEAAFQAHLQTPHFLKYKAATQKMVKSLTLTRVAPLLLGASVRR